MDLMAPLIATSSQPASHEWRRRSLVRVRRPAWADSVPEAAPVRDERAPSVEVSAQKDHTTHDDIAW
jgi:hypothetical protein